MSKLIHSARVERERIRILVSEDHASTEYHKHDFLELAYILDGETMHFINGVNTHLRKGDYFIVDYGTAHKYKTIGNKTFSLYNCMFSPRIIDETLRDCRRFEDVANNYQINFNYRNLFIQPTKSLYHDTDGKIRKILSKIYDEYETRDFGYQEIIKSKLIELLIETMRKIKLPNLDASDDDMVQHIMKHVQKHFTEKLSLESIAKPFGYSLSYVSRIFKKETGMNFQKYVQFIRINESNRLLINSSTKVTDIAMSVGYSDIKFFNKIFKQHTGMTPREYRKTYAAPPS